MVVTTPPLVVVVTDFTVVVVGAGPAQPTISARRVGVSPPFQVRGTIRTPVTPGMGSGS